MIRAIKAGTATGTLKLSTVFPGILPLVPRTCQKNFGYREILVSVSLLFRFPKHRASDESSVASKAVFVLRISKRIYYVYYVNLSIFIARCSKRFDFPFDQLITNNEKD